MGLFNLKGFKSVFDTTESNEILDNLVEFFDWGLLEKGNYFNVDLGELNSASQDISLLDLADDKMFTPGVAWEGSRPNWVWQSGVCYEPGPNLVSGVYVDDVFYPSNSVGAYAHHVDYLNGRVVFDSAIPITSKVQVEHSYKWINVGYANSSNGVMKVIAQGGDELPPELMSHLPAIDIEVVARPGMRGYQLGGGQWVETIVLFHCVANSEIVRNKLVDIVTFQQDKVIILFNSNRLAESGKFPLDFRGSPIEGAMNYPQLVVNYPRKNIRLFKTESSEMVIKNKSLFGGVVKMSAETVKISI